MEYRLLGSSKISVSRLGFGALTIGPLQAGLSPTAGGAVIRLALEQGINFIDTAELYGTYPHIKAALAEYSGEVIVASKSYAYDYQAMEQSVYDACRELNRDYIDIFSLHEQVSRLTLKGHRPALDFLIKAKQSGLIRAIGVSTHTIEVVKAATLIPEIDVIHPIINQAGLGIIDGTAEQMLTAINEAAQAGKGIYAMKVLAGGHLGHDATNALQWALDQPALSSMVVGMQSTNEVIVNKAIVCRQQPPEPQFSAVISRRRQLLIEDWCSGCGRCVRRCPMGALALAETRAVVNHKQCVLCGYCAAVCPEFCLKVI